MVLSAQWELVLGNSYNYTVFSAYGNRFPQQVSKKPGADARDYRNVLWGVWSHSDAFVWRLLYFRGRSKWLQQCTGVLLYLYAQITCPRMRQYLLTTPKYGLCLIPSSSWGRSRRTLAFLNHQQFPNSSLRDLVTIATYAALEIYLCLLGASYFVAAEDRDAIAVKKAAGSFAFIAGLLGYYSMGHVICQDQGLPPFLFPMGDVHLRERWTASNRRSAVLLDRETVKQDNAL